MSAVVNRRLRITTAGAASLLALSLLTACGGERDPTKWSDSIQEKFVAGCDGSAFKDEKDAAAMKAASLSTKTCECIYTQLKKNMDFGHFSSVNSKLRDNPAALKDPKFVKSYKACGVDLGSGDQAKTDK